MLPILISLGSCQTGPPATFSECRDRVRENAIEGKYTAEKWYLAKEVCDGLPVTDPRLLARLHKAKECRGEVLSSMMAPPEASLHEQVQAHKRAVDSRRYRNCDEDLWDDRQAEIDDPSQEDGDKGD